MKRVRITEQVSDAIGLIGPIDIEGDDPSDMCLYINVVEYMEFPMGCTLGLWTDLSNDSWYMNIGKVMIDPFNVPVEETADMWIYLVFQPVDQRLP